MDGVLWPSTDSGPYVFLLLTVVLGGAAAIASGHAIAKTWRPVWLILPYMIILSAAVRFLHFALYEEDMLSIPQYVVTLIILLAAALCGYRATRARQMATQYSWGYERTGLNWRAR